MDGELFVTKGKAEDLGKMRVKTIVDSYNFLVKKYNDKEVKTINVEMYLRDIPFLLDIINNMSTAISKYKNTGA